MKKAALLCLFLILLLFSACGRNSTQAETAPESAATSPETSPICVTAVPATLPPEPEASLPPAEPVILLTEEEQTMLLKLGMAERGNTECTECIALVMRTVLNRVESGRFGKSIRSVILAKDQFTPVSDGSYYSAEPNDHCREALELVIYGWDESQGALFYEWCQGESWHSKNLHLLFQHCDIRFYN